MEEEKDIEYIPNERLRRIAAVAWLWFKRGIFGILLLFLFLNLLLQIPAIQNWAAREVTSTLKKRLGTEVRINYLYLAFFDKIVLDGFYVKDYYVDTLLYSQKLKIDINTNPVALYRRGLEIEEIGLTGARIYLRRVKDARKTNFEIMLERLISPESRDPDRKTKPFRLNIKEVSLEDVLFMQDDAVKGKLFSVYLTKGLISLDEFDLHGKRIIAKNVRLYEPVVKLEDHPEHPLSELTNELRDVALEEPADSAGLYFSIGNFQLVDGKFELHNYRKAPVKTMPDDILDYRHMEVFDINIRIDSFSYSEETFQGQVRGISLRDISGFELDKLAAQYAHVSPQRIELHGLEIITPHSQIGDTLIFKYPGYAAFSEFTDEVILDGRLNNASVALQDIMVFAPRLEDNNFFSSNRDKVLQIDGSVQGKINNLRGKDLNVILAGSTLKGSFNSRNLAVRNEEILNLRLERLRTDMNMLRQLIPNFTPPPNFDKLGQLDFQGSFDGFFVDFVAYGNLRTDIGRAEMDMRMNLKQGRERANYSGKLTLRDFDVGKWSGNPNFGIVNFTSEVKNGIGLSGDNAYAELDARIESFRYKGYNYENATLQGELNKYLFNGFFAIQDDNVDFSFRGGLDYSDSIPVFDFNAAVNKLDLKNLNLSKKDITLAGIIDLNLQNNRLSDMEGTALIDDLRITHNQTEEYLVDSVFFSSTFDDSGAKTFTIRSDLMQGEIHGIFDIEQIPGAFLLYVKENFPEFANRFGVQADSTKKKSYQFDYDFLIHDSKDLNILLDPKLGRIEDFRAKGYFDNQKDSLLIDLDAPRFRYNNIELIDAVLILKALRDEGNMDFAVDSTVIDNKTILSTITLISIFERDTLTFGLNYSSDSPSLLDNLSFNGRFYLLDSANFQVRFEQSNLVLLETPWVIDKDNYISFGKKYVDTRNFVLTNRDRKIILERIRERGLKLSLFNFDFSSIDEYWDYDELDFQGRFNAFVEIGNVFNQSEITATALADTLFVNDDDWGAFRLDVESKDLKSPFNAYMAITKDTSQILVEGFYNPPGIEVPVVKRVPTAKQPNYFDFTLDVSGFPLKIAEYWIGNNVSDVQGSFGAGLRISGTPSQPDVTGYILAQNGAVTIDFLKTRYTFDQAFISASNYLFDATGTILKDKYGHSAVVYEGISHNRLKDLGFKARLRTQRFLALDTRKGDNSQFYGHAIGSGDVRFSGSFQQPDIYINARVGDSTRIVIPISAGQETTELNFIRFVEKHKKSETDNVITQQDVRGMSLEMDLVVTQEANMELVFDEQAGDIIRGKGRGNIRLVVPRQGDFQMFGDYIIEEGNYLFTLYSVVNKDFRIKRGGVIQWTGDPYSAQIQLEAEYKDLKTPVLPFINEYLETADADIRSQAAQATDVELTLILRGELLEPAINFDVAFPSVTSQLQTYTDNKLRILKQDQNEMNRQVFGLIVVGQFLPSNLAFQGSDLIYNTVSEFVSNQLSLLITELFSELIAGGTVLSGIDFDIAYNQYQTVQLGDGQDFSGGDEFQVRLRQDFFNDRLSILVGGNVDFGNNLQATPEASGAFVGNDLIIEYILNKDRSLKLRVYQRLRPDIGGGSRLEVGTGLSFRREFDTFGEFLNSMKKDSKK
jgi:hypothetical protein